MSWAESIKGKQGRKDITMQIRKRMQKKGTGKSSNWQAQNKDTEKIMVRVAKDSDFNGASFRERAQERGEGGTSET